MTAPQPNEYAPFYEKYVSKIGDMDVIAILQDQLRQDIPTMLNLPADRHDHAYAPGKWTLKEVIGHMADTERIFAYRVMRIGRGDSTPLPGFDENMYVPNSRIGRRHFDDVVGELASVRMASLTLIESLDDEALAQFGTASGYPVSTKGVIYSLAGHWMHHTGIIRDRYL